MGVSAFYRTYWDGRAYRRTKIYQKDHTFHFGDVVRWTGTEWVLASADNADNAEALGVVSHSGYRGEDETLATEEYARRAIPSTAFSYQTRTDEVCNDPRHYFSIVFRGEITIPRADEIDYSQNALLTGTGELWSKPYTPGAVYYLSPFDTSIGKLIIRNPTELGTKKQKAISKPMLIALDYDRAVVVNYVGSYTDYVPDEWVRIQDIQKVGALGAFLESTIPESWIACDGRLCTTDQYRELGEAIGGSVRVAAKMTVETDPPQAGPFTGITGYCLLDFNEENIDVSAAIIGEPLNIKLRTSNTQLERSVIIDSVLNTNQLRVIADFSLPPDGITGYVAGQQLDVKVRAPYVPGIDSLFFVPNLRNRTVRGADAVAVFSDNPNIQSDLGDFSGSNTIELPTGNDIASSNPGFYEPVIDVRANALQVIFAIKARDVDCGSFINQCCSPIQPVGLNENAIINGAFLVWQRGLEFSQETETFDAQPQYTADRWFEDFSIPRPAVVPPVSGDYYHVLKKGVKKTNYNPGAFPVPLNDGTTIRVGFDAPLDVPDDIETYAQLQGTLMTATRGPSSSTYAQSTQLVTGETQQCYHYFENRVEDARTFSGDTVTLSFWARGTTGGSVYTTLRQHFAGTRGILDDAYSTPVEIVLDGSSTWRKYEIELDIPDIQDTKPDDGYIGGNSFLGVQFWTMYFDGLCTGSLNNPTTYNFMETPPPENNFFGGFGGGGQGGGSGGGGVPLELWCQASAPKCCSTGGCNLCAPGDLCGTVASGTASCCSGLAWVVWQPDPNNPPGDCSLDPFAAQAAADLAISSCGQICFSPPTFVDPTVLTPTSGNNCCRPGVNSPLLAGFTCIGNTPPDPNCFCMQQAGVPLSEPNLKLGSCGCGGGGDTTESDCATANRLCQCCQEVRQPNPAVPGDVGACINNDWGCGAGVPSPTPSIPPSNPPSNTPPPQPSNSPGPSVTPSPSGQPATPTVTPTPSGPPKSPTPTPSITPSPGINHECVTNCCIPVLFDADFNYGGILHLTGVQLIRGKSSVPFQETDYLEELKKCQRYFEKDEYIAIGGTAKVGSGPVAYLETINYMVPKRKLRQPCVKIQGHYEPDGLTGCTLDTLVTQCYNDESAVFNLTATPTQATIGLCAAYMEYEVDVDLYESPCPAEAYCTAFNCAWEEVS